MNESDPINLGSLETALSRLGEALDQVKTEWTRDASIKRFEFTFELAWKSIARLARREGRDVASPRQALRTALQLGWIQDDDIWIKMHEDRNRSTHTYNEVIAEAIYERLPDYHKVLKALLNRLKQEAKQ